jgi:hypothetical protein
LLRQIIAVLGANFQQFVYKFGNISLEILSGSAGVLFSGVLKQTMCEIHELKQQVKL